MTDPRDTRSKAEASYRLAELAKTPRARELFKQLAEDYESRAREQSTSQLKTPPDEQAEAAPSIVPAAPTAPVAPLNESEQWLASLAAVRGES